MNRFAASLFALLALLLSASCGEGDTHEKAAKDGLAVMGEFTEVLADIKDKQSAEANLPKLEALVEKMSKLSERMEALGDPTEEQTKAMSGIEDAELQGKFMNEMFRIASDQEINAVLEPAMKKLQSLGG